MSTPQSEQIKLNGCKSLSGRRSGMPADNESLVASFAGINLASLECTGWWNPVYPASAGNTNVATHFTLSFWMRSAAKDCDVQLDYKTLGV